MKTIATPFIIKRHQVDSAEFSEILKSDLRLVYGAEGDSNYGDGVVKMPSVVVSCSQSTGVCNNYEDAPSAN